MKPSKTLSQILLTNLLVVVTLACVLTGSLWTVQAILEFNAEVAALSERLVASRKERMQREVDAAVAYLDFMRGQVEQRTREVIRGRVSEAHRVASHLYETYKAKKTRAELEDMVREALRPIRFLNGRGYYFATRMDGLEMLCADCQHLENKNLIDLRDSRGAYVIRDMAQLIRKEGEGFYRYTWTKPESPGRQHDKLAFIKHFEPFDWFIGTGEYLDDTESDLQQEALSWIRKIRYDGEGYLFAGHWNGLSLSGPAAGKNMLDVTDPNGVKIVQEMIRVAQQGGGFVEYVMPKLDGQKALPKISYARGLPAWQWYVGTGLYIDDIDAAVSEARQRARVDLGWNIAKTCTILLLLWVGVYWLVARLNARIQAMFDEFTRFFNQSAEDHTDMPASSFVIQEFRDLAEGVNFMIERRRKADQALRLSETHFREIFDEAPVGYHECDSEGRITRVNHTELVSLGYTEAEMLGHPVWEFAEESELFQNLVRDKLTGISTSTANFEWNGVKKDGTRVPLLIRDKTLHDETGKIVGLRSASMDITERKQAEKKINDLAYFDQLTNLPNRTLLHDRLKQAMASGMRSGSFGALLLIDLDYFKTLNDTLGHDMGDLLLKQVAQRLSQCMREEDTVARLGGDEFVVMLVNLGESQTEAASLVELIGRKVRSALNLPFDLNGVSYRSTPSIGASLFLGQKTEIDSLLKQADLAMYRAKDEGRNALRFFDPDMSREVLKRANLETDLRRATADSQWLLHYQAQVTDNGVSGAEALLRWQHPQRGLVFPGDFIDALEETSLILPVGQWVVESACHQLANWAKEDALAHLTIAVNISARQLKQDDFVGQILSALDRSGANPQRLKLELTESLLVDNIEDSIEKMMALKSRGVLFSLDDFGTGYSSLSYLKRFPLDQLKIDQSFVRDILIDPNDAAIAKMIVVLAENLGFSVIAEGVETQAQRDILLEQGCRAYQGYYYSRPLPLDEFERFAKRFLAGASQAVNP